MLELKKYQSQSEAIADHEKNYRSEAYTKGKFDSSGPDKYRINRIVDHIERESTVLDIGCNDGGLSVRLADKYCTTFGVDVVPQLVEIAINRGCLARVGKAEELPFKDQYFDAVNLSEVMEHLYDPNVALKEVVRVLKKDGVFTGSVPHPDGQLGKEHETGGDYHQCIFDKNDLLNLFNPYFEEIEIMETPYNETYWDKYHVDPNQPQWWNWVCRKPKNR